jgi:hypothetical protein
MDNSMRHDGVKITEKLAKQHTARDSHPSHSLDLNPYDFWLFGMLKEKMKDKMFWSEQHILAIIT